MTSSQAIMLVLAALTVTMLVISAQRRKRRLRRTPAIALPDGSQEENEQRQATRDVQEVMVELDNLSRQIHGRIDARLARLEQLLQQADDRIARLSRLPDSGVAPRRFDVTLPKEDPAVSPPANQNDTNWRSTVLDLARRGMTPVQIAETVRRPAGEIELVLALQRSAL